MRGETEPPQTTKSRYIDSSPKKKSLAAPLPCHVYDVDLPVTWMLCWKKTN